MQWMFIIDATTGLLIKAIENNTTYHWLRNVAVADGFYAFGRLGSDAVIAKFDWQHKLQYSGKRNPNRPMHKHEKLKYRVVTWIEQHLLNKRMIGGFRNYILKK